MSVEGARSPPARVQAAEPGCDPHPGRLPALPRPARRALHPARALQPSAQPASCESSGPRRRGPPGGAAAWLSTVAGDGGAAAGSGLPTRPAAAARGRVAVRARLEPLPSADGLSPTTRERSSLLAPSGSVHELGGAAPSRLRPQVTAHRSWGSTAADVRPSTALPTVSLSGERVRGSAPQGCPSKPQTSPSTMGGNRGGRSKSENRRFSPSCSHRR